nr:hypothetical protein [Tanacetum cinerariifolium]
MPKRRSTTNQFKFQRQTPAIEASSTRPSTQAQDDTSANIACDSPSPADVKTCATSEKTNSGEKTDELDQGQARSDPVRTLESRPPPERVVMDEDQAGPDLGESRGALDGPDPDPTHNEFMADLYPKNLDDAYAIGDQFINDKFNEDEPEKPNVEAEVVFTKNKTLDYTSRNIRSRVFTLELRYLPHKIDEAVRESVREAVHVALQALVRDRFRELPEADMIEILHQRMFETGTYKSLPEHRPEWLKPIPDEERPATPEPAWVIPKSYIPDAVNNWDKALATMYQAPAENSLLEKTRDMQTFMYCKGSGHALSISKLKDDHHLDFGLELLVPEHMWINEVIRTHMRILSVVSIKAYSRYGYDYLKEITLRKSDYQEYMIAEKDFKNLYPNDFEDLNLLLLQGDLNHLSRSDQHMLFTAVKLWTRNLVSYALSLWYYQNIRVIPKYHSEDGNPARSNIKQALGRFDTYTRNHVKEIPLKIESTRSQVQVKMENEIPRSSGVYFITACSYSTDTSKEIMKVQVYASKLPQL